MKLLSLTVCTMIFFTSVIIAQNPLSIIYDAQTATALVSNHVVAFGEMHTWFKKNDKVREYQDDIGKKVAVIHGIQNKMYRAHFEVSAIIRDGRNLSRMSGIIADIGAYQKETIKYAADDPELMIMAVQGELALINRTTNLMVRVFNTVTGGDENLLSGKQRMQIIRGIIKELRIIRALAYGVLRNVKLAKRVGIIKAIDPFDITFPNQDQAIVDEILKNLK